MFSFLHTVSITSSEWLIHLQPNLSLKVHHYEPLVSNKFHGIVLKLPDKLFSFCNTRKEDTVSNRLHIGHSYLTHSFVLRQEEAPVCAGCNAVITVKLILSECADLLQIRKKYFDLKVILDFLRKIGVFYKT